MHNEAMDSIDTLQRVPLGPAADGTMHIGSSNVSLESVLYPFKLGATPEEIAQMFPSVELADIYAVIAYYLNHRGIVEAYLSRQEAAGNGVQAEIEAQPGYTSAVQDLRDRLLSRWPAG